MMVRLCVCMCVHACGLLLVGPRIRGAYLAFDNVLLAVWLQR